MKYFVNYDYHMVTKRKDNEEAPKPFKKNFRDDHGWSEWVEIDEKTYEKIYEIYWNEAINR